MNKKRSFCRLFCLSLFLYASEKIDAQSVVQTMRRLPDTGEYTSYTTTFGEDNDYSINTPYFIANGDGTITDTITGLMWQVSDGGEMTFEQAQYYCDTLTLGGYSNWRLPSAHESFSILNHQFSNPAMDASVFVTSLAEYWWTSNRQANDSTKIWVSNSGGGIGNHPKNETISAGGTKRFHVRAVRDVQTPIIIPAHYSDNGDGTVTDHLTNLVWQKIACSDTLTWEQALTYADTLMLAGMNDWRLPNIKEMQSINDESLINPSLNTSYFPGIGVKKFWSSTTLPNQITKAWYLETQFGVTTYDLKTLKHSLLCVRGGVDIISNLSTEFSSQRTIKIYPNPFSSYLRFGNPKESISTQLLDIQGHIYYEGIKIEQQNLAMLPIGVYFLKVNTTPCQYFKLLKEK